MADRLVLARAALHFWEEPPISGEAGSGAVFFSGCSLGCVYCQNRSISQGCEGIEINEERLVHIFLELQDKGALNVNLVTPTHFGPIAVNAIAQARARGLELPIVWNTSGYENVAQIEALDGVVDIYLTDFKYFDNALAQRYSHVSDYREVAIAALDAMCAQNGADVIVRHMMLPGHANDSRAVVRLLHERYGDRVTLSLMSQYTPCEVPAAFPELQHAVSTSEYDELLTYADELGIEEYFWQEGPAAAESFIPAFDGTGVESGMTTRI